MADAAAGVLLNVFAPRNGAEFRRVLRADGVLLVVTPTGEEVTIEGERVTPDHQLVIKADGEVMPNMPEGTAA